MEEALVEIQGLKKYFSHPRGLLHAVDDVSMRFEKGHTMGVVGESGCGKSTLGRTIIHLHESSGGKILFRGEDVTRVSARRLRELRRSMQIIFQDPYSSLNPRMTVEETIREPLVLAGRRSRAETEREVERVARAKAAAIAETANSDDIIIAADTIVVCGEVLGKPKSEADAASASASAARSRRIRSSSSATSR